MIRGILIALGSIFLLLGVVGVVVPGLPTTPFILLAAACYLRSSPRLYARLLEHRIFGKLIRDFQQQRAIPRSAKIASVAAMGLMVSIAVVFLVRALWLRLLLAGLGAAGITVVLLFRTTPRPNPRPSPTAGADAENPER